MYFASVSRELVEDVAALLLRFEIMSRIKHVTTEEKGDGWFTVDISGSVSQRRFVEEIGGFGHQEIAVVRLKKAIEGVKSNANVDTIPSQVFHEVGAIIGARGSATEGWPR